MPKLNVSLTLSGLNCITWLLSLYLLSQMCLFLEEFLNTDSISWHIMPELSSGSNMGLEDFKTPPLGLGVMKSKTLIAVFMTRNKIFKCLEAYVRDQEGLMSPSECNLLLPSHLM